MDRFLYLSWIPLTFSAVMKYWHANLWMHSAGQLEAVTYMTKWSRPGWCDISHSSRISRADKEHIVGSMACLYQGHKTLVVSSRWRNKEAPFRWRFWWGGAKDGSLGGGRWNKFVGGIIYFLLLILFVMRNGGIVSVCAVECALRSVSMSVLITQ